MDPSSNPPVDSSAPSVEVQFPRELQRVMNDGTQLIEEASRELDPAELPNQVAAEERESIESRAAVESASAESLSDRVAARVVSLLQSEISTQMARLHAQIAKEVRFSLICLK